MAHTHYITDSDRHFIIDPITRSVTSNSEKIKLIQRDHNSERLTFTCPRFIEGHDMSLCDSILVQYTNTDKRTKEESCDVYSVNDVKLSADKSMIEFSWLISETATRYVGPLKFLIEFICIGKENAVVYSWHTDIFKEISIGAGMHNEDAIIKKYPDVLSQLKEKIDSIGDIKDYAKKTEIPKIPTKVSLFENDAGYLTEHQSLEEYAKKSEVPVIPTATSEDNGKFLRVVDGVWTAAAIPNANGVSF